MVEGAESATVSIDWLDEVLGEFLREREHYKFVQDMNNLEGQAEEVRRQLDSINDKIK